MSHELMSHECWLGMGFPSLMHVYWHEGEGEGEG